MAGKKTKAYMESIEKLCIEFKQLLNNTAGVEQKWSKTVAAIIKLPTENRKPTEEQAWQIMQKKEQEYWAAFQKVANGDLAKKRAQIDKKMKELKAHLKTFTLPTPTGKKFLKYWGGQVTKWEQNWSSF